MSSPLEESRNGFGIERKKLTNNHFSRPDLNLAFMPWNPDLIPHQATAIEEIYNQLPTAKALSWPHSR